MTEASEITTIAFYYHDIGGKFAFSLHENPDDGLIGPFETIEDRDQAVHDFVAEQAALAVTQELFN